MILELGGIFSFLLLGLGLGILHAFDPDHIAAVGGLSVGKQKLPVWLFSLHWSLGHGTALISVAIFVLLLGSAIPASLSSYAEKSVGFVLVLIGSLALYRIAKQYIDPRHSFSRQPQITAPVVGLLHGTAGSAPLLALIPLAQLSQPSLGVFYVLFFSVGVLTAMTGFGALIAFGLSRANKINAAWLSFLQFALALFSLGFGFYLIVLI